MWYFADFGGNSWILEILDLNCPHIIAWTSQSESGVLQKNPAVHWKHWKWGAWGYHFERPKGDETWLPRPSHAWLSIPRKLTWNPKKFQVCKSSLSFSKGWSLQVPAYVQSSSIKATPISYMVEINSTNQHQRNQRALPPPIQYHSPQEIAGLIKGIPMGDDAG